MPETHTHDKILHMAITTVAELIRAARNGRTQAEFARELGVRQSSVSRYESGRASPPVKVIEHCMRMTHSSGREVPPTADELAAKVRIDLGGAELGEVRLALARLIDRLASDHARGLVLGRTSLEKGGGYGDAVDNRVD